MESKIIWAIGVIAMLGLVGGMFGGMIFENPKIMFIGTGIWALGLVVILAKAAWNYFV